jgi:hypothetical protein
MKIRLGTRKHVWGTTHWDMGSFTISTERNNEYGFLIPKTCSVLKRVHGRFNGFLTFCFRVSTCCMVRMQDLPQHWQLLHLAAQVVSMNCEMKTWAIDGS